MVQCVIAGGKNISSQTKSCHYKYRYSVLHFHVSSGFTHWPNLQMMVCVTYPFLILKVIKAMIMMSHEPC